MSRRLVVEMVFFNGEDEDRIQEKVIEAIVDTGIVVSDWEWLDEGEYDDNEELECTEEEYDESTNVEVDLSDLPVDIKEEESIIHQMRLREKEEELEQQMRTYTRDYIHAMIVEYEGNTMEAFNFQVTCTGVLWKMVMDEPVMGKHPRKIVEDFMLWHCDGNRSCKCDFFKALYHEFKEDDI